jgi:hypothetical protein
VQPVLGRGDHGELRLVLDQGLERLDVRRVVVGEDHPELARHAGRTLALLP